MLAEILYDALWNRSLNFGSRIGASSEEDTGDDENCPEEQQPYGEFPARNEHASSDSTRPKDMKDSSLLHKDRTERMNLIPLKRTTSSWIIRWISRPTIQRENTTRVHGLAGQSAEGV
jgi:hypothetical protein